jgi:hypothetical protein
MTRRHWRFSLAAMLAYAWGLLVSVPSELQAVDDEVVWVP